MLQELNKFPERDQIESLINRRSESEKMRKRCSKCGAFDEPQDSLVLRIDGTMDQIPLVIVLGIRFIC